jgi:hypothetical protein
MVSKAVVNKVRAKTKNKASVVYINSYKKRNIVKSYTKTDDDWLDIPRADDPTKTLPENGARLCGKIIYELHKNHDRPVYLTSHWFNKITKKKIHQNIRLRKQLRHIFNFVFHESIRVEEEILFNVYEVSYTNEAYNILNFKDENNEGNTPPIACANKLSSISENAKGHEQKCSSYIDNKEKEEHPKGCDSSFSDNEKLKIKNSNENENQHATFAPCNLAEQEQVALTAKQEKAIELDRKQRTSENTGMFAMSDLMNQLLNEPQKTEEIPEMKHEELPLLTDKQERAILLSRALWQSFGEQRSNEIQDDYKFVEQDEQKVCIQTKEMRLNDIEKAKIRKTIQSVYGEDVTISMQIIAPAPVEQMLPVNQNTVLPIKSNLLTFKSKLLIYNMQQMFNYPVEGVVKVIEAQGKIIVDTVVFLIERMTSPGNIDDLERAVVETGLTLELHTRNAHPEFKNFQKDVIVLTKEKILENREWLENHRKSLQEGNNGI